MAESSLQGQISVGSIIENISKKSSLKWIISFIAVGTIVLIVGLAVGISLGNSLKSSVKKDLVLDGPDDTELTDNVLSTEPSDDADMLYHYDFYLFNITNVADVLIYGDKPVLAQCGPYSYKRYPLKMEAEFSDDNVAVTYLYRYVYELDSDKTDGDPFDDQITMINPFYLSTVASYGSEEDMVLVLTSAALSQFVEYLTAESFELTILLYTGSYLLAETQSEQISLHPGNYFYTTWANATSEPTGWPSNMLVSGSTPSKISLAQATSMWTCSSSLSFCSSSGSAVWHSALVGSNASAYPALVSAFGLSDTQMSLVLQWLNAVWSETATDYLLDEASISSIDEIGYAQWGSGSYLGGESISNLYGLTMPIEIAIWAEDYLGIDISLSASNSQLLLSGPDALTDPNSLASFLDLVNSSQFVTIYETWNLQSSSAIVTAEYITAVMEEFVIEPLTAITMVDNGGLFSTRTPEEWVWGVHYGSSFPDPLVSFITGDVSPMAILFNDSTVADAVTRNLTATLNTGKKDVDKLDDMIAYNGISEVDIWANEIDVQGTDGLQFEPFQTAPASFGPRTWNHDLLRPVDYEFDDTFLLEGIELYRYIFQDYMFEENSTFYMKYVGLWNMSAATNGSPLFLSTPHFAFSYDWVTNVTGLNPENDTQESYVGIEPYTGMTMSYRTALQVNFLFNNHTLDMLSMFNTNLSSIDTPLMFPAYWVSDWGTVSEQKAKDFKNNVHAKELLSQRILLGCVISGTVVLVVGLTLLAIWLANRNAASTSVVTPIDATTTTADAIQPPIVGIGLGDTNEDTPKMLPMEVATKDQWESEYASGKAPFGVSGSEGDDSDQDEEGRGS